MIINRWLAPIAPEPAKLQELLNREVEGVVLEEFPSGAKIGDHRHHWTEVRVVVSGELLVQVSGNQTLLRPGDSIEIPPNTKHSYSALGGHPCASLTGVKLP